MRRDLEHLPSSNRLAFGIAKTPLVRKQFMQNDQIGPVALNERIELLDVLRGLAVCGILIGNMQWFSGYGMMPPALEGQVPMSDQIVRFLVHFFVEGKF